MAPKNKSKKSKHPRATGTDKSNKTNKDLEGNCTTEREGYNDTDLVWARTFGTSYFPAIVTKDLSNNLHTRTVKVEDGTIDATELLNHNGVHRTIVIQTELVTQYYVKFVSQNTMMWIPEKNIIPYKGISDYDDMVTKDFEHFSNYYPETEELKKKWKDAVSVAEHLMKLKISGAMNYDGCREELDWLIDICNRISKIESEKAKNNDDDSSKTEETITPSERMQKLKSADGIVLQVAFQICEKMSYTIWNMILDRGIEEEDPDDEIISLRAISGICLKRVIKWCNQHRNDPVRNKDIPLTSEERNNLKGTDNLDAWDLEFFGDMGGDDVMEIIMAANSLEIEGLQTVASKYVALNLKGKTPQEMRDFLGTENDLSSDEDEKVMMKNVDMIKKQPIEIDCSFSLESYLSMKLKLKNTKSV